jgi:hypothetical protein
LPAPVSGGDGPRATVQLKSVVSPDACDVEHEHRPGLTRFGRGVPATMGRVNPQMDWVPASMHGRTPGRTVAASTADHRSRRSQMDAMTQLLLAVAILFVLKIAAIELR